MTHLLETEPIATHLLKNESIAIHVLEIEFLASHLLLTNLQWPLSSNWFYSQLLLETESKAIYLLVTESMVTYF